MTDSSAIQIPLGKALTGDMMYGIKPTAPRSRSYKMNLPPMNKNIFVGGDQVVFEIPTGRAGSYLDYSQSFYKFSVQCATTTLCTAGGSGVYVDNTAYSFFQRQDILHSSNVLESQNEIGQLANYLIDNTLSASQKAGLSAMIGCNQHYGFSSCATATATQYSFVPYNL